MSSHNIRREGRREVVGFISSEICESVGLMYLLHNDPNHLYIQTLNVPDGWRTLKVVLSRRKAYAYAVGRRILKEELEAIELWMREKM